MEKNRGNMREKRKQKEDEYKKADKELKKAVQKAKKNYEKKIAKEGKKNPKKFYSYLKKEKSNRVRVGPLKDENGTLILDPTDQANLLNQNYERVFTMTDLEPIPRLNNRIVEEQLR